MALIFDKSPVPLFIETGATIDVGGAALYVAGAGDPTSARGGGADHRAHRIRRLSSRNERTGTSIGDARPRFRSRTKKERQMIKIFGHPASTCTRKVLM